MQNLRRVKFSRYYLKPVNILTEIPKKIVNTFSEFVLQEKFG